MTQIDQQPHFWPVLDALPYPVLYKDLGKPSIYINAAGRSLLGLNQNSSPNQHNAEISLTDIKTVILCHANTHQPYHLLNNPLIHALSGNELNQQIFIANHNTTYDIHSRLITLPYTLHQNIIISLQQTNLGLIESNNILNSEEINETLAFNKLISLISTQLINVKTHELAMHINDALAAVGEFSHVDRAYVFKFNNALTEMSNTYEWVRPGVTHYKGTLQNIPQQALPYFYKMMQQNFTFSVSDITTLPAEADAEKLEFARKGIRSVLCSAMRVDDKVIGFVGCDMVSSTRSWTSNDLRRLKLLGEMIGNTLQSVAYRRSLQSMQQQLVLANAELKQQAMQDGLTGIANRRHFDENLQQELQRSARSGTPLSLVLLDIDRFKLYNDYYGHQAGDDALKQLAGCLSQVLKRQGDLAARYGGEEFVLILADSTLEDAVNVSKQIQQLLIDTAIEHKKSDVSDLLTVSIGCCSIIANKNTQPCQLIKAADKALYAAKSNGRNQIKTLKLEQF